MRLALLFLALTVAVIAQPDRTTLVTRYPMQVWRLTSVTGWKYQGLTNTPLALPLEDAEARYLLVPEGLTVEQALNLVEPFKLSDRRLEGGRWPARGVYEPGYPAAVRLRLYLKHRWYEPACVLGLLLMLGVGLSARERRRARELERGRKLEALAFGQTERELGEGTRLGDYRLLRRIGSGGTATVFRAIPEDSLDENESVAVKVVHREVSRGEEFQERFRREIVVCKELNHPAIVRILDYGEERGLTYLVMEYLPGPGLRSRMPSAGMAPQEALELIEPIMEGVAYAHVREVVHRDLKPENILLRKGRPVITDFGLARRHDMHTLTETGSFMGTPSYMAPEQAQGGAWEAADQYSLGVLLYEMLAGKRPFEGQTAMELIFLHLEKQPPPLEGIDPELWAVVSRMLAKSPQKRFPSVAEALDALRAAVTGRSAQAAPVQHPRAFDG